MSPLISVAELNSFLNSSDTEQGQNLVIFDCRFELTDKGKGFKDYQNGHIPGAVYADLEQHLSGKQQEQGEGRHPLPQESDFISFLNQSGVSNKSIIVVYDDHLVSYAARMWWMLEYYGLKNVRVLNGGLNEWKNKGYEITDSETIPFQSSNKNSPHIFIPNIQRSWIKTTAQVEENLTSKEFTLVDARDANRFEGRDETMDHKAGHIPGAINLPFKANLEEGLFKSVDQLKNRYSEIPNNICMSCGSGVTACNNILAMRILDMKMPTLYVGSWSGWIEDDRPIINS